jgi:ABC-2 type transport system permease protein
MSGSRDRREAPATRPRAAAFRAFLRASRARSLRSGALGFGLFLMPVLVTLLIGLAFGRPHGPAIEVGIVGGGSPALAALRAALEAEPELVLRELSSEEELRASVRRGRLVAGLVVPERWRPGLPLALHLSDASAVAPIARALIEAALASLDAPTNGLATRIGVESAVLGGGREPLLLGYRYTAPANLVMFAMITALVASSGIAWQRQSGIGRRLLATGAGRVELLLGLAAEPLQLGLVQAGFLLLCGSAGFGVKWGPPLAVGLVTLVLVAVATALSLCMGTVFRTREQALALGPFLGMGLGMLGGCWWPLEVAPAPLRAVARLFPTTWAMEAYLDLSARGGGLASVAPRLGVLAAMALGLGALAVWRLRRELARG